MFEAFFLSCALLWKNTSAPLPPASGVMSPRHAMASSIPVSASHSVDGDEGLPADDEFQEARDGASQPPEGSLDREFPDATPLDPPYFESQQGTRSVIFGLSAEVAQYLDQGSGSDPSETVATGAPGLVQQVRAGDTVARAESVSGSAAGGSTVPVPGGLLAEGAGRWKDDTEMMPDYESAFSSLQAPAAGRDVSVSEAQDAGAALNYSLAASMRQFFQQQVSPMLEQVLLGQEVVMSRLDKLEQDQQIVAGQQRESGSLMDRLQKLSLGHLAPGSEMNAGATAAPFASSSLDVVMADRLAVSEQHSSAVASVGVQQSDSQGFSAGVEKDPKDPNRARSFSGHQESKVTPSGAREGVSEQGVVTVEGVPYAWRMTPEGLKLQRLEVPRGPVSDSRGRTSEAVHVQSASGARALSPFVATSAEIEKMTPNIRRFHSTSPPRSRSSPKPRPGVLKKSPESPGASLQQTPSESRRVVPVKPRIVYPCTPGGTEIRPPPHPCLATEDTKVVTQLSVQGSGDWLSSGLLGSGVPPPPPIPSHMSASANAIPAAASAQGSGSFSLGVGLGAGVSSVPWSFGGSGSSGKGDDKGRVRSGYEGGSVVGPPVGHGESPEEPTRTSIELPKLDRYNPSTAAIVAGDWLASLGPTMATLSTSATLFWEDSLRAAQGLYQIWVMSSPLERLVVQAETLVARFRGGRYARVDQRAVTLLLAAISPELKEDIVTQRLFSTPAIVFRVLTRYQPGGGGEKQQLLSYLVGPESVTTFAEAAKSLRKWRRWLQRASELGLRMPDPSLLLKALERLTPTLGSSATFRVQSFRSQVLIEQAPTEEKVWQLSELLLAEAEEALLLEPSDKGPKKPTVAKADGAAGEGASEAKGAKGKGKGKQKSACRLWKTDDGCKYGRACQFQHDSLNPSDKRCFNCGSLKHRKPECTRPKAAAVPQSTGEKGSQKGSRDETKGAKADGGASASQADDKAKTRVDGPTARDQLIQKATEVLESLQSSVKYLETSGPYPPRPSAGQPTGLLDSGATSCLRAKRPGEKEVDTRVVALAEGEVVMGVTAGGVLLSNSEIEPIVAMRSLVRLGFRLVWGKRACQLFDPKGRSVPISVASGCPRVSRALALELIDKIEQSNQLRSSREQVCMTAPGLRDWNSACRGLLQAMDQGRADTAFVEHRTLLADLFPGVPDGIAAEVSEVPIGDPVPPGLNRHRRRRIKEHDALVLHLCCGKSRRVLDGAASAHKALVVAIDREEDLNNPSTYAFLLRLCLTGKVSLITSGLPCRTRSVLRGRGEGPPVVRGRFGDDRWGFPGLPEEEMWKVVEDDSLWVRTLSLSAAAQWGLENRFPGQGAKLGFGLENPSDPALVFGPPHCDSPSIWITPEYRTLEKMLGLKQHHFDQGPLGHQIRKPTTVGATETFWPGWCSNLRGPGWGVRPGTSSAEWSEWATGLKQAFAEFTAAVLAQGRQDQQVLARVNGAQSFRDHVLAGHVPFRKDCFACVAGRARRASHFRQEVSEAYVLSLDLAGPLPAGVNEKETARYFLAASFSLPVDSRLNGSQKDGEDVPTEGEAPLGWDLDLDEDAEQPEEAAEPDSLPVGEEEGKLEELQLIHIPFAIPLRSKKGPEVLGAVKAVEAQLSALGCQVARVHSDAGLEFCNGQFRAWCRERGFHKTNTGGDRFKSNPQAESLIGILKGCARTLMQDAAVSQEHWPYAVRHAARQRFCRMVQRVGWSFPPVIPFGAQVHVRQRSWNLDKGGDWRPRVVKATVLAPARELTDGYLVKTAEGDLLTTPCVYEHLQHHNPSSWIVPPEKAEEGKEVGVPTRRVRVKTPSASVKLMVLSPRFFTEDEMAGKLADARQFDLDRARDFVLGSQWRKHSSGRLRGCFDQGGGSARVLGFFQHGGVVGITNEVKDSPGFVRLLARMINVLAPSHAFTTLTLLSETRSEPHKDKFNMPNSNLIVPLTIPENGGGLWIETDQGEDFRQVTPKKQVAGRVYPLRTLTPMFLDPHKWHGSESWDVGSRVLLVAYSLKGFEKVNDDQRCVLEEAGFLLPQSSGKGQFRDGGVDGNSQASPSNTAEGRVQASQETMVSSDLDRGVPASHETSVSSDLDRGVPASRETSVSGALDRGVPASRETSVSGALDRGVPASHETSVSGALDRGVPASRETSVSGALDRGVPASRETSVSGALDRGVPASHETSVSGALDRGVPASRETSVSGALDGSQGASSGPSEAVDRALHDSERGVGGRLGFRFVGGNSQASRSNNADGGRAVVLDDCNLQVSRDRRVSEMAGGSTQLEVAVENRASVSCSSRKGILVDSSLGRLVRKERRVSWATDAQRDAVRKAHEFSCHACHLDSLGICAVCERDVLNLNTVPASPCRPSGDSGVGGVGGVLREGVTGSGGVLDDGVGGGAVLGVLEESLCAASARQRATTPNERSELSTTSSVCMLLWGEPVGQVDDHVFQGSVHSTVFPVEGCVERSVNSCDFEQRALKEVLRAEARSLDRASVCSPEDAQHVQLLSDRICRMEEVCCKFEDVEASLLDSAEVLTSHTVPGEEVERHFELWREAAVSELISLLREKKALELVTKRTLEGYESAGTIVTYLPAKMVWLRKAGGRFKARLTACGNFMPTTAGAELAATGVDVCTLRIALSHAVRQEWCGAITDVATAFLNAPLLHRTRPRLEPPPMTTSSPESVIALRIPKVLTRNHCLEEFLPEHGENEEWFLLVLRALYGLDQSPRDWSIVRDGDLSRAVVRMGEQSFCLLQSRVDANMWFLQEVSDRIKAPGEFEPLAILLVYIDDFLALGSQPVVRALLDTVSGLWKCGKVEWIEEVGKTAVKFFGFELRWSDGDLLLSQCSYIEDIARRYPATKTSLTPLPPGAVTVEEVSSNSPEDLAVCQSLLGELIWLACRTRPDIAYAVSRLAGLMTRNATAVKALAHHLLGYVIGTADLALRYTREPVGEQWLSLWGSQQVLAQTDASFAPAGEKSHEATFLYVQGNLVGWLTARQPFMAASTAEAELLSTMTGFVYGRAQGYICQELWGSKPSLTVQNDNTAAISIVSGDSTNWRSRHLRIRSQVVRQAVRSGQLTLSHVPGEWNVSDAGTKSLPLPRLKVLRDGMGLVSVSVITDRSAVRKLQGVVFALTVASATGQRDDSTVSPKGEWELAILMFLTACTAVALWELCRWGLQALMHVFRPLAVEPEQEFEGVLEGEEQPDHEDDLVELPLPLNVAPHPEPVPTPTAEETQALPRFDAGDPEAVDRALRGFALGQRFVLRYVDDELVVQGRDQGGVFGVDGEGQRVNAGRWIREAEGRATAEVLRRNNRAFMRPDHVEAQLRQRRGQPVYRPEPEPELLNPVPANAPPAGLAGADARPANPEWVDPHQLGPVIGGFQFVQFGLGRWLVDREELPGQRLPNGRYRRGLLNMPPDPPLTLRPDWDPSPFQPTLRYVRQMATPWGGPESSLQQLPGPRDTWYAPEDRPSVVIRFHYRPRRQLFCPPRGLQVPASFQGFRGARRTLGVLQDGTHRTFIYDDDFRQAREPALNLHNLFVATWVGRTEFRVDAQTWP